MQRGVLGSLQSKEDYELSTGRPFDEVAAVQQLRDFLRHLGASGDGERFTVGQHVNNGRVGDDGAPALTGRLLSRLEVLSALSMLWRPERQAIELAVVAGWPIKDTARQMDCSVGTVHRLVRAGVLKMAKAIYDGVLIEVPPDLVSLDEDGPPTVPPLGYEHRQRCKGCGAFSGHSWQASQMQGDYCPSCWQRTVRHNGHNGHHEADLQRSILLMKRDYGDE